MEPSRETHTMLILFQWYSPDDTTGSEATKLQPSINRLLQSQPLCSANLARAMFTPSCHVQAISIEWSHIATSLPHYLTTSLVHYLTISLAHYLTTSLVHYLTTKDRVHLTTSTCLFHIDDTE